MMVFAALLIIVGWYALDFNGLVGVALMGAGCAILFGGKRHNV
jgi:hypothetical protein